MSQVTSDIGATVRWLIERPERTRQPAVRDRQLSFNRPPAPAERAVARLGHFAQCPGYVRRAALSLAAKVDRAERADLRWLALVPIVPAVPLIFFGIMWTGLGQLVVGAALLAQAAAIWIVFATDG